jgi:HEAT repeat protein
MKRPRLRAMFLVLLILVAGSVLSFELKETFEEVSTANGIRKLDSFWTARRRTGAKMLSQFTDQSDAVVPPLIKSLNDSDPGVRLAVLESLETFRDGARPAASAVSELLLHDPDASVRRQAASVLRVIKDKDTAPGLVKALDDADPAVRVEATQTLGSLGPGVASAAIVDKLLATLTNKESATGRAASLDTLAVLAPEQERVARAIAYAVSHDESTQVRKRAVDLIKEPKFDFQIPALIAALDDPVAQVRLAAATSLASVGLTDDRVAPALCHASLSADADTTEGVGMILDLVVLDKRIRDTADDILLPRMRTAVAEFRKVLESPNAAARVNVVGVLCRVTAYYQLTGRAAALEPARDALQAVLARLSDEKEDAALRIHVLDQWFFILRNGASAPAVRDELHPRSAWLAALCKVLTSADQEVRHRAREILLGGFNQPITDLEVEDAWRQAMPSIIDAVGSDDVAARQAALEVLCQFGPEARQALPALRSLADGAQETDFKSAVNAAIQSISSVDSLKAADPAIRIAGAEALGRLRWRVKLAVPALTSVVKDPDAKVRAEVMHSLSALGPASASAVPELVSSLANERDPGVRVTILQALDAIAPGTPPVLGAHVAGLSDPEPPVRAAAAGFPSVPADELVVAALVAHLGDPSEEVRKKVASSLSELCFEHPAVGVALFRALHDQTQREAVLGGLGQRLDRNLTPVERRRIQPAVLTALFPAIKEALACKDDPVRLIGYRVLGRITLIPRNRPDENLQKAAEQALTMYLEGLTENDPSIREEVLHHVGSVAIGRADIGQSLNKFLERSDSSDSEREQAQVALKKLETASAASNRSGGGRSRPPR